MKLIKLPHKITLRSYQKEAWNAFFKHKKKHMLLIQHRRAGKTNFSVNVVAAASQQRVGAYYYLLPTLRQARRVVWEGRGKEGVRFIDHFPPSMIKKTNNVEMKIEFWNGSIFRLLGTDRLNYDSLVGGNPLGIIYDEFALQNPVGRDYLLPIIGENDGWEMIISTPRGTNHLFELYDQVKDNDRWYTSLLTVDDTKTNAGERIISDQAIGDLRDSGWSEDKIQQEFYCSFTAAVTGAYYSVQLKQAEAEGRIRDYPIQTNIPIDTFWDIGYRDSTAVWIAQFHMDEIRVIAYYENSGEPIAHYINWIKDFRDRHNLTFGYHYGPHDIEHKNAAVGKSVSDIAREVGFRFERALPKIPRVQTGIELARSIFSRCLFHKSNCKRGLDCLREYHKKYNDKMQSFSDNPEHNWASHGSDAFRTMAEAMNHRRKSGRPQIINTGIFD